MDLADYIAFHKENKEKSCDLVEYLYYLMDNHGLSAPELYNKANLSRQLYSSIISGKSKPSLPTLIKIAFALRLNTHECKLLLKKTSYTLSSSSTYSLIVRYCIENGIYDLNALNRYLSAYGYEDRLIY